MSRGICHLLILGTILALHHPTFCISLKSVSRLSRLASISSFHRSGHFQPTSVSSRARLYSSTTRVLCSRSRWNSWTCSHLLDLRIRIRSEGRSLSTLQSTSRRTLSSDNSLIYTLSENGTTLLPVLSQTERILVNSKTKESIFNKLNSLFRKQSRREDDFDYLQKNSHLLMEEAGVLKEVEGLDRSQFTTVLPLLALKIPAQETTKCMSVFKNLTFNRPRMKRVFNLEHESQVRLVLLTEGLDVQDFKKDLSSVSNLDTSSSSTSKKNPRKRTVTQAIDDTQSRKSVSKPSNEMLEYLSSIGGSVVDMPLQLTYADMNVEEVLSRVLPSDIEVPGSYEQVGHVAHLNLREEQLPYKQLIGQVILDKHYPQLRTVVNKVGQIENEFRTFPMEILSGVDDLDVVVKESNAVFKFNFKAGRNDYPLMDFFFGQLAD